MAAVIGNGLYGQALAPIRKMRTLFDSGTRLPPTRWPDLQRLFRGQPAPGQPGGFEQSENRRATAGAAHAETKFGSNPRQFFAYVFPGLAIFALMFIAQSLAIRLLRDRLKGLQRRLAVTPVPSGGDRGRRALHGRGAVDAADRPGTPRHADLPH